MLLAVGVSARAIVVYPFDVDYVRKIAMVANVVRSLIIFKFINKLVS